MLAKGEFKVEEGDLDEDGDFLLDKPTKIYGQGCGKTTLVGFGLAIECWMEWNKSDGDSSGGIVEIEDLTIKGEGKKFQRYSLSFKGASAEKFKESAC